MNNQTIEDHLKDVTEDTKQLTSDGNEVKNRIDELDRKIKLLNQKIEKYEKGLGGFFHTQYQNNFGNSKTPEKLDGIRAELESLNGDLSVAKVQKETIEKKLDNANSERNRLVVLDNMSKEIPLRINKLNREISKQKEKLKRFKDHLRDPAPSLSTKFITKGINDIKVKILGLKNKADQLETLKPTLDQLVSERQSLRNQFNSILNETTNTSNLIPDTLNEIKTELEKINRQLDSNLTTNRFNPQDLPADNLLEEVNKVYSVALQNPPSYEQANQDLPSYEQAISVGRRSSLNETIQNAASGSNLRNRNLSQSSPQVSIQSQQQGRQ